jgi:CubicO group peptidase (beta-lactamase class C family)
MQRRTFLALSGAILATPAFGQDSGADSMQNLSPAALADLDATMGKIVDAGQAPGAVWLVARGDDVHVGTAGTFGAGGAGAPMARDTIFRIASMSKPIGATAMMMLVEEGKVTLEEPVDRLLPELADRRVLTSLDAPLDSVVPAERPILVRDLLDFTLGFGLQFDPNLPIQKAIDENQLVNGPPIPQTPLDPDEWMRRLGTLPWMAQPGATWMYNTGSHIQSVLTRRASGQSLEAFLKERIFDPLGMGDTGFFVPAEKRHRFAPAYGINFETNETFIEDRPDGQWSAPPPFPTVAAGIVSTVDDYLVFARMLMNKGTHNGTRLLSEESVREMTRDQLTPEQKESAGLTPDFFDTLGWGYGMAVSTAPSPIAANAGRYGWDGGMGSSWANDPTSGLIGIMMTQSVAYYVAATPFTDFWGSANAAVSA